MSENNYLKKNNSFGIKLLKNKMKNINYSKTAYLKSQLPVMGLYKEFYDRKMKGKNKKEKTNEFKIKIVKKSEIYKSGILKRIINVKLKSSGLEIIYLIIFFI